MGYATSTDLDRRMPIVDQIQCTDDGGIGEVDSAVRDAALADADSEIDIYIGERYPLPLASIPDILTKIAINIAIYNLYARKNGPPDHVSTRYKNDIGTLEKIRTGEISLGIDDPDGTGTADTVELSETDAIFTSETLTNY